MAPYLLQWEAMRLCKAKGCETYDLLGISPSEPKPEPDSWSGLTRFKQQFGGTVEIYPPEQEIIFRPLVKRVLRWKRTLIP